MATFPSGVKTFTTRLTNDIIQPGHVNDLQDEVTAIETLLNVDLFQAVNTSGQPVWSDYTPTWTGGSPAIGNGTLTGRYLRMGAKTVFVNIKLTGGSGTTWGASAWSFSLPVSNALVGLFTVFAFDAAPSATVYPGMAYIGSGTTLVPIVSAGTAAGTGVINTTPFTWTTSDILEISGFYLIS